ncbi:MAG: hypothetical protein B0A82_12825, partial [Alkalinema sp. CACIAM 70d]
MVVRIKVGSGPNAPLVTLKEYFKAKRRHGGFVVASDVAEGPSAKNVYVVVGPNAARDKKRATIWTQGNDREPDAVFDRGPLGQVIVQVKGKHGELRPKVNKTVRRRALAAAAKRRFTSQRLIHDHGRGESLKSGCAERN